MNNTSVGIIANPASGKDIRRIVTYSSSYDNQEKVNIIRRVIMALHATGVRQVYYMPEYYNIVPQAINGMYGIHRALVTEMSFTPLEFEYMEKESDSIVAGGMMRDLGVQCIITLGGDGTNRAVAKTCGDIPLVPVSTGTNNAFPRMVEGTVAGLAAGVVAMGVCKDTPQVFERRKRLELLIDGELVDIALIDAVILQDGHIGARAMWSTEGLRQLFVTQCTPYNIGISSIPGQMETISANNPRGMALEIGDGGVQVQAAIAPGLISTIDIQSMTPMAIGDSIIVPHVPCIVAVDGERNLQINAGHQVQVRLSNQGPVVVNVEKALSVAAANRFFITGK